LLIGGWDFRDCTLETEWSPACVRAWTAVGFNVAWHGAPLFITHNRTDRTVRGFALATGGGALSKARVKVVYGVLQ
jgi:hypothetical protein